MNELVPIMKFAQIGILSVLLFSCSQQPANNDKHDEQTEQKQNNLYIDNKKSAELLSDHPDDFITTNGIEIKYPVIDSTYNLVWKRFNSYDTLYLSLPLIKGLHSSNPRLIEENKDYLYFENSCGSPCWNGFVLPLYGKGNALTFEYPIARDLKRHSIAIINDIDQIALCNLKTGEKQVVKTNKCSSAFTGYCIDTAYFEGVNFVYKWGKDAHMNSGDEILITKKIKWY